MPRPDDFVGSDESLRKIKRIRNLLDTELRDLTIPQRKMMVRTIFNLLLDLI